MNRKQFIESIGATCDNWQWSWSFVNEKKRTIIFGEWDVHKDGLIFSESWPGPGREQSKRHIQLIENRGYRLATFPMERGSKKNGTATIKSIEPYLTYKKLKRVELNWYAENDGRIDFPPEEISFPELYFEGATKKVSVNVYERNNKARQKCLDHYGYDCKVCGLNFEGVYGDIGKDFIHVHHVKPLSTIKSEYSLDPINDLKPVCPNCHAMLHKTQPPMEIDVLRAILST